MHNVRFGEICELSYHRSVGPCLPHLVRQLADRLQAFGTFAIRLTWDCDDIAIFDIPGHRIILATAEGCTTTNDSRLLISVGPAPQDLVGDGTRLGHAALCRRIARGIERKHPADQRQIRSWPGVLTPERVDDLFYASNATLTNLTASRDFVAPRQSDVLNEEKRLRIALSSSNDVPQRNVVMAGLFLNCVTWSIATASPAIALAAFGSNMIGALMSASVAQLPR